MNAKLDRLKKLLKSCESVAVGYSGGTDSAFLLAVAHEVLKERALGVIARSPLHPQKELDEALATAEAVGARVEVTDTDELDDPLFTANPPNRCYICKLHLFKKIRSVAEKHGLKTVLEGANADDLSDYRPGMKAAKELGVEAPLLEAGLTKNEIRALSRKMGLATWNKPAAACLASRIPYETPVTAGRLSRIEQAESGLRAVLDTQLRVRDHGDTARIELEADVILRAAAPKIRAQIVAAVKQAGFRYVCLDLCGYRTGALNEVLQEDDRNDISR